MLRRISLTQHKYNKRKFVLTKNINNCIIDGSYEAKAWTIEYYFYFRTMSKVVEFPDTANWDQGLSWRVVQVQITVVLWNKNDTDLPKMRWHR